MYWYYCLFFTRELKKKGNLLVLSVIDDFLQCHSSVIPSKERLVSVLSSQMTPKKQQIIVVHHRVTVFVSPCSNQMKSYYAWKFSPKISQDKFSDYSSETARIWWRKLGIESQIRVQSSSKAIQPEMNSSILLAKFFERQFGEKSSNGSKVKCECKEFVSS